MKFTFRIFLIISLVWIFARGAVFLLPGDPVDYLINESLIQMNDEKTISEIRERMDLDISFPQRVITMPSGKSLISGEPVGPMLERAFLNSLELAALTLFITLALAFTFLYLGYRSEKWNRFCDASSVFLASIPIFISGPILLFLFSLKINVFPAIHSPFLPALCLGIYLTGFWYRSISQKISNYLPLSAVPGARARGIDELRIFVFYVIAPCLGSLIRFFSAQVGNLLNGSLIVEIIFKWEGIGFLLSDAINRRDYPVIETGLMTVSLITLISLQAGKWLQLKLEPAQR